MDQMLINVYYTVVEQAGDLDDYDGDEGDND
jgi:hypothetical protein